MSAISPLNPLNHPRLARRDFLLGATALCCAAPYALYAQPTAALDLGRFLELSLVLTSNDVLSERASGQLYFDSVLAQSNGAATLSELWQRGGFGGSAPPRSVADLQQRGIYADARLQALCDAITLQWYSGIYQDAGGQNRVATYTTALAWRALPYRPAGPSTCGGAFGHWAKRPVEV